MPFPYSTTVIVIMGHCKIIFTISEGVILSGFAMVCHTDYAPSRGNTAQMHLKARRAVFSSPRGLGQDFGSVGGMGLVDDRPTGRNHSHIHMTDAGKPRVEATYFPHNHQFITFLPDYDIRQGHP